MRLLTFCVLKRSVWRPWQAPRALCSRPAAEADAGPTASTCLEQGELVVARPSWPPETEPELRAKALASMRVLPAFVTEEEEQALLDELEPVLKRMRYEYDHWDNAIEGYRETERAAWAGAGAGAVARVRRAALGGARALPATHVLDLAAGGHIKPHIDAVRFCGAVIAGLSLLSDAVMRLEHETNKQLAIDALLPRRSLYIMSGVSRYEFTHAVLGAAESEFMGRRVPRRRRLALICRSAPPPSDAAPGDSPAPS